ncbi:MAG: flagellar FliJ family protein [Chlamydiales bacterium]
MQDKLKYPLEQVLEVKRDRVEKAERVVEERKRALQIEENKLKKVEKERDKVLNHHNDKLAQMRQAFDEGTTSEEILQMKRYLKVVKEQLAKEEEKVREQKKQVHQAERKLEEAKKDLHRKRIEEEKIKTHKEEWLKEAKAHIKREEAKEHDEIGQILYEGLKRKKKESE